MIVQKPNNVEKVHMSWNGEAPDWIIVLAESCDRENQTAVAKKVGYASSTISQVLSNSYHRGDFGRVEQAVRGALMAETVYCQINGDIPRNICLQWQRKPFAPTNSHRVRMFQACRDNCPHSYLKQEA